MSSVVNLHYNNKYVAVYLPTKQAAHGIAVNLLKVAVDSVVNYSGISFLRYLVYLS